MKIYPGLTTTKGDWRERIKEIEELRLEEITFFPTCLSKEKRLKSYDLLEKSGVKKIPFMHLRSDMSEDEVDYLIREFKTEVFNIHSIGTHRLDHDLSKFKNMIYLENQSSEFQEGELDYWAGLCFDFSHLENARINKLPVYDYFMAMANKYSCGCAHVNAIISQPGLGGHYDRHYYDNLKNFDYLAKYKDLMPEIIALELENTIAEQLKAKEYIESLISS